MHMKYMNKKRILLCIQEFAPISRAEIAAKINISKPTVSMLVEELIRENWVYEKGSGESSSQGGRRPIQLYFNEKAMFILGTDIGGTKVHTILSDLNGSIIGEKSFHTAEFLKSGLLEKIAEDVDSMLMDKNINRDSILGLGAGVPGITDSKRGIVLEAPSLDWVNYPFIEEAKRYFEFPVVVDNDVNAAALGEQWLGAARDKKNVLFIAVGTGIGSGIIINNQLYRGAFGAAGEMGYMVTDRQDVKRDFKPVFQHYGYLESVAGGKSIGEAFTRSVRNDPGHPLYMEALSSELTGEMAFLCAAKGDGTAKKVIGEATEHLAFGVINAASLLNPEIIILGGGVSKSSNQILPKLCEMVKQYLPGSLEIQTTKLGNHAGVLGAVSLFLREHKSILTHIEEGDFL
ncbi:sugar kinase [Bacillus sp. MUM 13]|nr:sugar kinase [Bacillus sp. MUM 13]